MFWYLVWRGPLRRGLGMDPNRVALGDRSGRWLPSWPLLASQATVLVGMAPLYSVSLLLRFGLLPALLWTVLGSMLLACLPYLAMQWATLRSEGKSVGALMFAHLGGRGKQLLLVTGWLMSVLMLAMMVQIVTFFWDSEPQIVRPVDYTMDPVAMQQAQESAEPGAQVDITPYIAFEDYEQALESVAREAGWRSTAMTASLGLIAVAALYGVFLYRFRRYAWLVTLVALAGLVYTLWQSTQYPLELAPTLVSYGLFGFALLSSLVPSHWLQAPRDMLVGILTLCLAAGCVLGSLFTQNKIAQPMFVSWNADGVGTLFPFLLMTTIAGGANAIYMLSIPHRMSRFELREESGYSVVFGGTLTAAFVGVVTVIAVGQYGQLPLAALRGVVDAPRLVLGAVATMLTATGLPLQWAWLAVTLVFVGCGLGALEMSVRLGASLLHGIYFHQSGPPRAFSIDRLLASFTTVMAAMLINSGDFWMLWPLFGAASMGVCAVALLPVALWLRASGRGIWKLLGALCGLLAALSLGCMAASLLAQVFPSNNNILTSGSLILHGVVIVLMLATMIHALTGIGKPPRELPPTMGK